MNDAGGIVVTLGSDDAGDGLVLTQLAKGKELVKLTSTMSGNRTVTTYQPKGKELVKLGTTDNGGAVGVHRVDGC